MKTSWLMSLLLLMIGQGCVKSKPATSVRNTQTSSGTDSSSKSLTAGCLSLNLTSDFAVQMAPAIHAEFLQSTLPQLSETKIGDQTLMSFSFASQLPSMSAQISDPQHYVADYGMYEICAENGEKKCIKGVSDLFGEDIHLPSDWEGVNGRVLVTVKTTVCAIPQRRLSIAECGREWKSSEKVFFNVNPANELGQVLEARNQNERERAGLAEDFLDISLLFLNSVGKKVPKNRREEALLTAANNVTANYHKFASQLLVPDAIQDLLKKGDNASLESQAEGMQLTGDADCITTSTITLEKNTTVTLTSTLASVLTTEVIKTIFTNTSTDLSVLRDQISQQFDVFAPAAIDTPYALRNSNLCLSKSGVFTDCADTDDFKFRFIQNSKTKESLIKVGDKCLSETATHTLSFDQACPNLSNSPQNVPASFKFTLVNKDNFAEIHKKGDDAKDRCFAQSLTDGTFKLEECADSPAQKFMVSTEFGTSAKFLGGANKSYCLEHNGLEAESRLCSSAKDTQKMLKQKVYLSSLKPGFNFYVIKNANFCLVATGTNLGFKECSKPIRFDSPEIFVEKVANSDSRNVYLRALGSDDGKNCLNLTGDGKASLVASCIDDGVYALIYDNFTPVLPSVHGNSPLESIIAKPDGSVNPQYIAGVALLGVAVVGTFAFFKYNLYEFKKVAIAKREVKVEGASAAKFKVMNNSWEGALKGSGFGAGKGVALIGIAISAIVGAVMTSGVEMGSTRLADDPYALFQDQIGVIEKTYLNLLKADKALVRRMEELLVTASDKP